MTQPTMIELHLIQSFPPNRFNSGDDGAPKNAWIGGTLRSRLSSQTQKAAMVLAMNKNQRGIRTRLIVEGIMPYLADTFNPLQIIDIARVAFSALYNKPLKEAVGIYLLYLAPSEWEGLARLCKQHAPKLLELAQNSNAELPKDLPSGFVTAFVKEIGQGMSIDIALFGRFIADLDSAWVNGAMNVAHAFSTQMVPNPSIDYFVARDMLSEKHAGSVAMIKKLQFTSACMYRYASIDMQQLQKNLKDHTTRMAAEEAIRLWITTVPNGGQHSFAAYTPPSLVFGIARYDGATRCQLSNAFVKPISGNAEFDIVSNSIQALDQHWGQVSTTYNYDRYMTGAVLSPTDVPLDRLSQYRCPDLDSLINRLLGDEK